MPQSKFRVGEKAPLGLFLRSEPAVKDSTKIAVLPMGHLVNRLAEASKAGWWEVSCTLDDVPLTGFISAKFLSG